MAFVTRGNPKTEDLMNAIYEAHSGSDRACAIVVGSLVEVALTDALTAYLHRNKKITDEMFRTTGALGAFASKIRLGFLIGLYGRTTHRDFETMKDIRNSFAHRLDVHDFEAQKIRALCHNLTLCERYTIDSNEIGEPTDISGKHPREWSWWVGVNDRANKLTSARERYLVTGQVLTYGLAIPFRCGMPNPVF